jgi:hypothetical protein
MSSVELIDSKRTVPAICSASTLYAASLLRRKMRRHPGILVKLVVEIIAAIGAQYFDNEFGIAALAEHDEIGDALTPIRNRPHADGLEDPLAAASCVRSSTRRGG